MSADRRTAANGRDARKVGLTLGALAVGTITLAAVLTFAWWWGPDLLTAGDRPTDAAQRLKAENDARTALVATIAALAALGGLIFTARTVGIGQRNLRLAQQSLNDTAQRHEQTERLQLDARIGDWYVKAIEQLSSPLGDVRIGALYALQRVVKLSAEDQEAVAGVLCAFVWERTHNLPMSTLKAGAPQTPDRSVQIAMQVLADLPRPRSSVLPLSGARIPLVVLRDGAFLVGAELAGTDLTRAVMRGVRLSGAGMEAAFCPGAALSNAEAAGLRAPDAVLEDADLEGADLRDSHLLGANLRRARLTGATLSGADLRSVDLSSALLQRADLTKARLHKATLAGALLDGADLRGATFDGTGFSASTVFDGARLDRTALDHLEGPPERLKKAIIA